MIKHPSFAFGRVWYFFAVCRERNRDALMRPYDVLWSNRSLAVVLVLVGLAIGSGLYSVYLGSDINWDLLNYHIYNPFASLNNRYLYDIEPAQGQTYLNPALDIPFYILVRYFNDFPRLIGFVQGAINGVNLLCAALIAWRLLGQVTGGAAWLRWALSATAVVIGGTGADSSALIGTTTGDIQVTAFVLCGVVFAARSIDKTIAGAGTLVGNVAISGLFAGLAFGLKPTTGPFGLGLVVALAALGRPCRIKAVALFVLASLFGGLIAGGYHAVSMYELFSNPVFPAFNNVFHSPYFGSANILGVIKRGSMLDVLSFPFQSIWQLAVPNQGYLFRDIRPAIAILLGVLILGSWVRARATGKAERAPDRAVVALAIFVIVSFYTSLAMFNNYRYLGPIEYVSGVVIVAALGHLFARKVWIAAALAVTAACLATTVPLGLPHSPWASQYISVSGPDLEADTLVAVAFRKEPAGYLAPFFNPGVRWVRLRSNLYPADSNNLLTETAKRLVATHEGPMMSLELPNSTTADSDSILRELNVERTGAPCLHVVSNLSADAYLLCPIRNRRD